METVTDWGDAIFLSLTIGESDRTRAMLALRIARNAAVLLVAATVGGSSVLLLFGSQGLLREKPAFAPRPREPVSLCRKETRAKSPDLDARVPVQRQQRGVHGMAVVVEQQAHAHAALGFDGVNDVRQGKYIEVDVAGMSEDKARAEVERMCRDLLANTVIENYSFELAP